MANVHVGDQVKYRRYPNLILGRPYTRSYPIKEEGIVTAIDNTEGPLQFKTDKSGDNWIVYHQIDEVKKPKRSSIDDIKRSSIDDKNRRQSLFTSPGGAALHLHFV